MKIEMTERICAVILEELLIELNRQMQYVTPYKVSSVSRSKITVRRTKKVVFEQPMENKTVKGAATLGMTTLFIDASYNHRVEAEVRLNERTQDGRIRVRAYKGTKVVGTIYSDLSSYKICDIMDGQRKNVKLIEQDALEELFSKCIN